ncbi:hypothetical protein C1E23_20265 [Pseudoalteromonas phenolica]|uniref:Uncharacterized protein n=1 Tax=Pseudoalteromonas phenolica TaxID=161398 RepID=A0A4V2EJ68_9GAMM|nr:hypothetical protein [Pseudoalteromonas phenolica]RZQ51298.1 hypothetical protein C1E23_20265 [Pseudoalteromonas phenolica]
MFNLIRNNELELQLDISGVEDHLPSIAFDIVVSWDMPYQKINFTLKECWFECEEWDRFEESISQLIEQESGSVTLKDMSENPIITFTKTHSELLTIIQSKDTLRVGEFSLRAKSFSIELTEVYNKTKQLDKWW